METLELKDMTPVEIWEKGDELYKQGEFKDAFSCFEAAAHAGNVDAMYDLGYLYHSGEGVDKSYEQARKWYEQAASENHVRAMYKLGVLYEQADDLKNFTKAAEWYQKASDLNDMYAQCNLGILYYTGLGVTKNKEKAMALLKESADQGYERATDMLTSIMYREEVLKKKED